MGQQQSSIDWNETDKKEILHCLMIFFYIFVNSMRDKKNVEKRLGLIDLRKIETGCWDDFYHDHLWYLDVVWTEFLKMKNIRVEKSGEEMIFKVNMNLEKNQKETENVEEAEEAVNLLTNEMSNLSADDDEKKVVKKRMEDEDDIRELVDQIVENVVKVDSKTISNKDDGEEHKDTPEESYETEEQPEQAPTNPYENIFQSLKREEPSENQLESNSDFDLVDEYAEQCKATLENVVDESSWQDLNNKARNIKLLETSIENGDKETEEPEEEEADREFQEKLHKQREKNAKEQRKLEEERERRNAEFNEKIKKLRNDSRQRFAEILRCILLKRRFEEQEAEWEKVINSSCRQPLRVVIKESEKLHELAKETRNFRNIIEDSEVSGVINRFNWKIIEVTCLFSDIFCNLNRLGNEHPDRLFIRALQKSLCDVTENLLKVSDLLEQGNPSAAWYQEVNTLMAGMKISDIPSTGKLKSICKTALPEDYEDLKFPERSYLVVEEIGEETNESNSYSEDLESNITAERGSSWEKERESSIDSGRGRSMSVQEQLIQPDFSESLDEIRVTETRAKENLINSSVLDEKSRQRLKTMMSTQNFVTTFENAMKIILVHLLLNNRQNEETEDQPSQQVIQPPSTTVFDFLQKHAFFRFMCSSKHADSSSYSTKDLHNESETMFSSESVALIPILSFLFACYTPFKEKVILLVSRFSKFSGQYIPFQILRSILIRALKWYFVTLPMGCCSLITAPFRWMFRLILFLVLLPWKCITCCCTKPSEPSRNGLEGTDIQERISRETSLKEVDLEQGVTLSTKSSRKPSVGTKINGVVNTLEQERQIESVPAGERTREQVDKGLEDFENSLRPNEEEIEEKRKQKEREEELQKKLDEVRNKLFELKNRTSSDSEGESAEQKQAEEKFRRELEEQKRRNEEKLQKLREERAEIERKAAEELERIRNESQQRIYAFLMCIQMKIRFEEKEEEWRNMLEGLRKPLVRVSSSYYDLQNEIRNTINKKLEEWEVVEFKNAVKSFGSKVESAQEVLADAFDKLKPISEDYSDRVFIKIIMKSLSDLGIQCDKVGYTLVEIFKTPSADSIGDLDSAMGQLSPHSIPTTTSLRTDSQTARNEDYAEIPEPRYPEWFSLLQ